MEKNFSSNEPLPSHLCHTHLLPVSDYKGRVGWVGCEGSLQCLPKQAPTGMAQSAPASGGRETQVSLSPPFATIILAAFLESVKQDKIAGLLVPLIGEHKSQHMWC